MLRLNNTACVSHLQQRRHGSPGHEKFGQSDRVPVEIAALLIHDFFNLTSRHMTMQN